jgi:hypothetical protein
MSVQAGKYEGPHHILTFVDGIVSARIVSQTRPSDSKVNQTYNGRVIRTHHHVVRFDITMDNSTAMNMLQRRELQSHCSAIRVAVGQVQHAPFDLLRPEQIGGVAFLPV